VKSLAQAPAAADPYADIDEEGDERTGAVTNIFLGMESVMRAKAQADEELDANKRGRVVGSKGNRFLGFLTKMFGVDELKWSHKLDR
jgi:hypothetical protein